MDAEILARLERIERRLDALEGRVARPLVPAPPVVETPVSTTEDLETLLGARWLPRAGAIAIVAAIAYLVGLGLQTGAITPAAVALGIAFACGAVAMVGARLRDGREAFGSALVGVGVGGLYVDAVGSHLYHELLSGEATIAACLVVSFAALAFGARRGLPTFLGIGAFGGLVAALMPLAKGTVATASALFLIVTASTYAVAAARRWPKTVVATWAAATLAALAILFSSGSLAVRLAPLDAGLFMALAAWSWAKDSTSARRPEDAFPLLAATVAGTAALVAYSGAYGASHAVALGLGALGLGAIARKRGAGEWTSVAGLGLIFVIAPFGLRPDLAAAILAALAIVGVAVGRRMPKDGTLRMLVGVQVVVALAAYGAAWLFPSRVTFEPGLITLLAVATIAGVIALDRDEARTVGGVIQWGLVTRLAVLELPLPLDTAMTVAWIATFAGLLAVGFVRRRPELRQLGLLVAAVTVAKVVLVDLSGLDAATKAAVLLGLGIVSMAGGYAYVRTNR